MGQEETYLSTFYFVLSDKHFIMYSKRDSASTPMKVSHSSYLNMSQSTRLDLHLKTGNHPKKRVIL